MIWRRVLQDYGHGDGLDQDDDAPPYNERVKELIAILVSHRWEAQLERVNDAPDETSSDVLLATDVTPEDYATIDEWLERIKEV